MTPEREKNMNREQKHQHTPGPWSWDLGEPLQAADGIIVNSLTRPPEIREANRRIVAAAPDLLAALKDILEQHSGGALGNRLENNARAALAKATGEAA